MPDRLSVQQRRRGFDTAVKSGGIERTRYPVPFLVGTLTASVPSAIARRCPGRPARLNLESRIDKATGEALARLGHKVAWWPDWTWLAGAVCTIVADHATGVMKGGADPRRPSYALGA